MSREVHAYPWEAGPFSHRADRRCPCGVHPMRDLEAPSRTIYVHRNPPLPERTVQPIDRALAKWAGPQKRSTP
jgi:hypothetical protein